MKSLQQSSNINFYLSPSLGRQYIIEFFKFFIYSASMFTSLILGFHNLCPDSIRHNFHLKYGTISFLLSVVVTYDGMERELYHYVAFGLINLCTTLLVCKEILRTREEEYRLYLGDDYEKVEKGEINEVMEEKS